MMMIKNVKPSKKSRYNQGYLDKKLFPKYVGKGPITFRSSLEKKFCYYCESNPDIKSWSYEEIEIEYFDPVDSKNHRYYPDFICKLQNDTILLIEVKPYLHIIPPKLNENAKSKERKNYGELLEIFRKNSLKFKAALKYCADRGWIFKIITENFFKK